MITKVQFWKTSFDNGEASAASSAILNQCISQGPLVAKFEREISEYLGIPYVIATTSGSMALLLSLYAIGIKAGDEIILPSRSWIATAHAPFLLGAKLVFVDVEQDRPLIDANAIEAQITPNTKAIIAVHLGGAAANMRKINEIAKKHNLYVIEDAAQALGSKNQYGYLGTQGDLGCFSLSVAKIISTGQGGIIVTNNEELYRIMVMMRTQGVGDVFNAQWHIPGLNFRFTDILASIGSIQLSLLDARKQKVTEIYKRYVQGLIDGLDFIQIIPIDYHSGEVPVYVEALCIDRIGLIDFLGKSGIEVRPYYPNMSSASYFANNNIYSNSQKFADNGMYLPCGPDQSFQSIDYVIEKIKLFYKF
jgi:dTDP-4-amino-4,6-dideoxygalactose transaminase